MTSVYFLILRFASQVRGVGRPLQVALLAIGLTALLFPATTVWANDTTGRVATNGISFTKSEDIRMVEEFLEISTKKVRVRYLFRNESAQNINTTVAFPMPPYGWNKGPGGELALPNEQAIADFTVYVNGHQVSTSNIVAATIKGRNITKRLREIGLSDAQIANHAGCRMDDRNKVLLCNLSRSQQDMLKKEFKLKKNDDPSWWFPEWVVSNTIVWKQIFPAGQNVVVEHTYTPFVGASYKAVYPSASGSRFVLGNEHIPVADETDDVCLDNAARKVIEKQIFKAFPVNSAYGKNGFVLVSEEDVEYILGTGRNWKGSIGKFTLRIKKETPEQVISLCFPGKPKMVDSTTYEFTQTDFVPQNKLLVYFYKVSPD